jgi:hypothetical protein
MTSENALRSDLAKAINAAARYPKPSVRDQMLMDAAVYLHQIIEGFQKEENGANDS